MRKKLATFCLFVLLSVTVILPNFAKADNGTPSPTVSPLTAKLKTIGTGAGYNGSANSDTALSLIGTIISAALGLLGVVFIILIIVAGYNWMTAAGDEEKIKKAGQTIRAAVIGVLIIICAYAIWSFVNYALISDSAT